MPFGFLSGYLPLESLLLSPCSPIFAEVVLCFTANNLSKLHCSMTNCLYHWGCFTLPTIIWWK